MGFKVCNRLVMTYLCALNCMRAKHFTLPQCTLTYTQKHRLPPLLFSLHLDSSSRSHPTCINSCKQPATMADDDMDEELLLVTGRGKAAAGKKRRKPTGSDDEDEPARSKRGKQAAGADSDEDDMDEDERQKLEGMNELEREMYLYEREELLQRARLGKSVLDQTRNRDSEQVYCVCMCGGPPEAPCQWPRYSASFAHATQLGTPQAPKSGTTAACCLGGTVAASPTTCGLVCIDLATTEQWLPARATGASDALYACHRQAKSRG